MVIAHTFVRPAGGNALTTLGADAVVGLRPGDQDFIWIDILRPVPADVDLLQATFQFHPLALEDVLSQHQRPKVDEYQGYYFVVLYAARFNPSATQADTSELQFFWGHNFLVTIHVDPFSEIETVARRLSTGEMGPVTGNQDRLVAVPDLVYRIVDDVVDGYFPVVDAIAEHSEDLEEAMFGASSGPHVLQAIFSLKKDLLHLRKVITPSRDVLNVLLRHDLPLMREEFQPFFQDAYDHTVRVIDSLDTYRDLLSSSIDVYLSIASNNVNQAVKVMTAVTAILMVDALIAGVYGMNFRFIPELEWAYGYSWALGLMAGASLALWLLFRRIRWM